MPHAGQKKSEKFPYFDPGQRISNVEHWWMARLTGHDEDLRLILEEGSVV